MCGRSMECSLGSVAPHFQAPSYTTSPTPPRRQLRALCWAELPSLDLSQGLPDLGDEVVCVGYPTGGDNLCLTQGRGSTGAVQMGNLHICKKRKVKGKPSSYLLAQIPTSYSFIYMYGCTAQGMQQLWWPHLRQGVVSRIDMQPYTTSARQLLVVQIDAAINPAYTSEVS